jgi:hypothetical protein
LSNDTGAMLFVRQGRVSWRALPTFPCRKKDFIKPKKHYQKEKGLSSANDDMIV